MAEFKYPLTRICLRSGTLTLPRNMLDLFPDSGTVEVRDAETDDVHVLEVRAPRSVAGLGPMFERHRLQVNDELVIRIEEAGGYAITPVRRVRPARDADQALARVAEELAEGGNALTEAEMRALYDELPAERELRSLLAAHPRFIRSEGRWKAAPAAPDGADASDASPGVRGHAEPHRHPPGTSGREADVPPGARAPADAATRVRRPEGATAGDAATVDGRDETDADGRARAEEPEVELMPEDEDAADDRWEATTVLEYPSGGPYLAGAGLNSEQEPTDFGGVQRARSALERFGFRVEGMGHGQLMAHAELGRRAYRVLVHVLPPHQRLDWSALLTRRRDTGARYLAVFGDHRDLLRLRAPADLARATLWSWDGLQRVLDLSQTVLISPVDLETHFERDGLFEHGLERFEQIVGRRIAERGGFSSVLTKLGTLRAPAIFLLEDLAAEVELPRDQLLKILERLGEAPFHLVAKVDAGEFVLRYPIADALTGLAEYATSLRDRLPNRRRGRVVGLGDDADEPAPTDAAAEPPLAAVGAAGQRPPREAERYARQPADRAGRDAGGFAQPLFEDERTEP